LAPLFALDFGQQADVLKTGDLHPFVIWLYFTLLQRKDDISNMLEGLFQIVSPLQLVLLAVGLMTLKVVVGMVVEDRKIQSLGSRAPIRKTWVPFGLAFVYDAITSMKHNKVLERFNRGKWRPWRWFEI
jgi:hypothetical protein